MKKLFARSVQRLLTAEQKRVYVRALADYLEVFKKNSTDFIDILWPWIKLEFTIQSFHSSPESKKKPSILKISKKLISGKKLKTWKNAEKSVLSYEGIVEK